MQTGFNWLNIGLCCEFSWTRYWTFGFQEYRKLLDKMNEGRFPENVVYLTDTDTMVSFTFVPACLSFSSSLAERLSVQNPHIFCCVCTIWTDAKGEPQGRSPRASACCSARHLVWSVPCLERWLPSRSDLPARTKCCVNQAEKPNRAIYVSLVEGKHPVISTKLSCSVKKILDILFLSYINPLGYGCVRKYEPSQAL